MSDRPFSVDEYSSILKSEVAKLTAVFIVLFLLFIGIMLLCVSQIKEHKKKASYIQLGLSILLFSFLLVSLSVQIVSYKKDISDNSYIQYEGPAYIQEKKQLVLGGIPWSYPEYVISFELENIEYELLVSKSPGMDGYIDNLYIVFSKHSEYVLEIEEWN